MSEEKVFRVYPKGLSGKSILVKGNTLEVSALEGIKITNRQPSSVETVAILPGGSIVVEEKCVKPMEVELTIALYQAKGSYFMYGGVHPEGLSIKIHDYTSSLADKKDERGASYYEIVIPAPVLGG